MRVFYLAVVGRLDSLGIISKIRGKIHSLRELGHEATALLLLNPSEQLPEPSQGIEYVHMSQGKDDVFAEAAARLRSLLQPEDLVILRYPMASSALHRLLKAHPGRIWLEHNTKEVEELWSNFRKYTWRDWLWMLRHLDFRDARENLLALLNEYRWCARCFALAAGGVGVTDEISDYEMARVPAGAYRCATVSNGIDTRKFQLAAPVAYNGSQLVLIMASTTANEWHGIDRFIQGMADYKGSVQLRLHLVGRFTSTARNLVERYKLSEQVTFHPLLSGADLNGLLAEAHLGIGSLGMHRIPLRQGSVLKVKEYMALGMPFLVAHEEIDLLGQDEMRPYFLQLPADESPVDLKRVVAFAESVFSQPDYRGAIRSQAERLVDVRVKMAQLVELMSSRCGSGPR
ncbi:glycosyltransferase [bacterium]|nr:glycosyltransferase [bacterium]